MLAVLSGRFLILLVKRDSNLARNPVDACLTGNKSYRRLGILSHFVICRAKTFCAPTYMQTVLLDILVM